MIQLTTGWARGQIAARSAQSTMSLTPSGWRATMNSRAITAPIPCQTNRSSSKYPTDSNDLGMPTSKETNALLCGSIKSIYLFAVATIGGAVVTGTVPGIAQTPAPRSRTKVEATSQVKAEPLSGADLWTLNCNRCHMVRSPGEFTAAQWETILMHMRVRANIPAAQAREIQKFLEAGAEK